MLFLGLSLCLLHGFCLFEGVVASAGAAPRWVATRPLEPPRSPAIHGRRALLWHHVFSVSLRHGTFSTAHDIRRFYLSAR